MATDSVFSENKKISQDCHYVLDVNVKKSSNRKTVLAVSDNLPLQNDNQDDLLSFVRTAKY